MQNLSELVFFHRNQVQRRREIVEKFIDKFQMKPEEIAILKGPLVRDKSVDAPIDEQIFSLLERCREIHEQAKILLKCNHQNTGLETMTAMESLENAAYERLHRWTLDALRSFDPESENLKLIQQAIKYISERPVMFKHCLDEYGTVRRSVIVRNLIDALTRGGPGGNPPPIDLNSNDPVRYVGDILAWVHQAKATEKEYLSLVLKNCSKDLYTCTIQIYVSFIVESLFRPVKSRIDLLVSSSNPDKSFNPLTLFKVKNLIKFYRRTLAEDLLPDSQLVHALSEIDSSAHRVFTNSLNYHSAFKLGQKSEGAYEDPPADLKPPEWFGRTIYMLSEIFSLQSSSLLSADDEQELMITMVNVVIKPLIQACRISAAKLPGLEMSIFLLNCYSDLLATIDNCSFVDEFKDMLKRQIDDYLESLINENASNIVAFFGLTGVYNAIKNEATLPLSTITGCDPLALQSSSVSKHLA